MRKAKKNHRALPFAAGLAAGYALTLALSAVTALGLSFTDSTSDMAWLAALAAMTAGSFLCGRTAGKMRRRGGLKTGAVCGALYFVPLMLLSFIFGTAQGILLPVKAALCVAFSAAGGVVGVNSDS